MASLKDSELSRLPDRFKNPPESNEEIDEAIRWYFRVLPARRVSYFAGIVEKLSWEDVKSLVGFEFSWVPTVRLAHYSFEFDEIYINHLSDLKEKNRLKNSKK